jgi:hypothetical protein
MVSLIPFVEGKGPIQERKVVIMPEPTALLIA